MDIVTLQGKYKLPFLLQKRKGSKRKCNRFAVCFPPLFQKLEDNKTAIPTFFLQKRKGSKRKCDRFAVCFPPLFQKLEDNKTAISTLFLQKRKGSKRKCNRFAVCFPPLLQKAAGDEAARRFSSSADGEIFFCQNDFRRCRERFSRKSVP